MSHNELNSASVKPHVLCVACKSFWTNVTCLKSTPEQVVNGVKQQPSMPEHVFHSDRQSKVESSALAGCHFCSILLSSIKGCTGDHGAHATDTDDPIYVSVATMNEDNGTYLLTLFPCEQQRIASHDQILNSSQLRLCPTSHGTETQKIIEKPVLATSVSQPQSSMWRISTYSTEAAEFVRSWVVDCQTNHPFCGSSIYELLSGLEQPSGRPKRVLDLRAFRNLDKIKLVEPEHDEKFEYCALSYSWGFSKPYVMTSSNYWDFKNEININSLPKLLIDAIHVVRGIGHRYLWIDALCIMQDGHLSSVASDDWVDQAGKMDDIFGNSAVTIAASESFDGNQRLIRPRNPLGQTTCRLDLEADLPYKVVPACTPYCLLHTFDKARYHLDTRAWVFQERILAPRTVHITHNFIHLECRTELRCEAMSDSNTCHHSGAVAKADYHLLFSMFGLSGLDDSAIDLFLSYWHELIKKYSTTNLSRPPDLLVALAGLAKQVQKRSQFTWSFGLWREHLLRDMLWYVRGGVGVACRERAPSWSWASIEVRGPQIFYEAATEVSSVANIVALPEISEFARQPALLGSESKYAIKVAGRLISGGYGPYITIFWPVHRSRIHGNCQGTPHLHPYCPFHPDYEISDNIELFVLLVAHAFSTRRHRGASERWITEVGIVLTPVKGYAQRYRRVGYFHHDMHRMTDSETEVGQPSLFENAEVQEVEII